MTDNPGRIPGPWVPRRRSEGSFCDSAPGGVQAGPDSQVSPDNETTETRPHVWGRGGGKGPSPGATRQARRLVREGASARLTKPVPVSVMPGLLEAVCDYTLLSHGITPMPF
ncbi:hypothetical protein KIPB_015967, partial [Kipferlia bialata]|eukprot:g15967.t1